jgi:hypothetical protein
MADASAAPSPPRSASGPSSSAASAASAASAPPAAASAAGGGTSADLAALLELERQADQRLARLEKALYQFEHSYIQATLQAIASPPMPSAPAVPAFGGFGNVISGWEVLLEGKQQVDKKKVRAPDDARGPLRS